MTARLLEVTPQQYHADPCEDPSLSASIARVLLDQSPLHAWYQHPKLGAGAQEPTPETQRGSIIHRLMLGKGAHLRVIHADNFRMKVAQEARDMALAAGELPLLQREHDELCQVALELGQRIYAEYGITLQTKAARQEVGCTWQQEGVWCRCLWDYVDLADGAIIDLKTIHSAHPKNCGRHAQQFGYDIQRASNTRALEALRPELVGRVKMFFLFCEIEAPFATYLAEPTGIMKTTGEIRWSRAVQQWRECLASRQWPGYGQGALDLPPWAVTDMIVETP
jgi:hypothetical protein